MKILVCVCGYVFCMKNNDLIFRSYIIISPRSILERRSRRGIPSCKSRRLWYAPYVFPHSLCWAPLLSTAKTQKSRRRFWRMCVCFWFRLMPHQTGFFVCLSVERPQSASTTTTKLVTSFSWIHTPCLFQYSPLYRWRSSPKKQFGLYYDELWSSIYKIPSSPPTKHVLQN